MEIVPNLFTKNSHKMYPISLANLRRRCYNVQKTTRRICLCQVLEVAHEAAAEAAAVLEEDPTGDSEAAVALVVPVRVDTVREVDSTARIWAVGITDPVIGAGAGIVDLIMAAVVSVD